MVKKIDPKLEQKLKEIEFRKQKLLASKLYQKIGQIESKYDKKISINTEKERMKEQLEINFAKKKIERQVDKWAKNQIRKAKGSETIKYKVKEKTIAKIKSEYLTTLQKYVRLRDSRLDGYLECISCNTTTHWKKANGGHYITRANNATCFDLRGLHGQCVKCNGFRGGNPIEYRKNLIEKIGLKEVEDLESLKYRVVPLNREEMIEKTKFYKEECIRLESTKDPYIEPPRVYDEEDSIEEDWGY